MPQIINDLGTKRRKYQDLFDVIFDGKVYLLTKGVDFTINIESMRTAVLAYAQEIGVKAETRLDYENQEIRVQAQLSEENGDDNDE